MPLQVLHRPPMDADHYLEHRDEFPRFAQLIDGEVVVNSPALKHQVITGELYVALRSWVVAGPDRGMCGIPVDVRVDGRNVYAPDVWLCRPALAPDLDARFMPDVPDLAVEVLSPSTRRYDLVTKRRRYEQQGLPELWFIDPKDLSARLLRRSTPDAAPFDVTVERGPSDDLTSPRLPGFAVTVDSLVKL